MKRRLSLALALGLVAGGSLAAHADEGMWLLNQFPSATTAKRYGFTPDMPWLMHVGAASARLAGGCSGSFVSPNGLVMTNHHCAHKCIAQLSTAKQDYVQTGFLAKTLADEVKCPEIEVNQLAGISDVSKEMKAALAGLEGKAYNDALKAKTAEFEKACSHSDRDRCEVVTLYHGGLYHLYKYRRFQDVRLVFAPEFAAAFFGGDPDNFNFPRYDLDVSFLRVYEDGKPLAQNPYFPWSKAGAADGELTFVTGHPGGTDRELTVAELAYDRDVALARRSALPGRAPRRAHRVPAARARAEAHLHRSALRYREQPQGAQGPRGRAARRADLRRQAGR